MLLLVGMLFGFYVGYRTNWFYLKNLFNNDKSFVLQNGVPDPWLTVPAVFCFFMVFLLNLISIFYEIKFGVKLSSIEKIVPFDGGKGEKLKIIYFCILLILSPFGGYFFSLVLIFNFFGFINFKLR